MALGVAAADGKQAASTAVLRTPLPPAGVDAGAFFDLVAARRRGLGDNLLAIDQAANNTSIVFSLEWRGWRLLFPGDAEQRSWKTMDAQGMLQPVHFLKIGHHGSHNGTPPLALLEKVMPIKSPDKRARNAVMCTCAGSYSGVPDADTKEEIQRRCTVQSVEEVADGKFIDIVFKG
jgi:hypothetical protein